MNVEITSDGPHDGLVLINHIAGPNDMKNGQFTSTTYPQMIRGGEAQAPLALEAGERSRHHHHHKHQHKHRHRNGSSGNETTSRNGDRLDWFTLYTVFVRHRDDASTITSMTSDTERESNYGNMSYENSAPPLPPRRVAPVGGVRVLPTAAPVNGGNTSASHIGQSPYRHDTGLPKARSQPSIVELADGYGTQDGRVNRFDEDVYRPSTSSGGRWHQQPQQHSSRPIVELATDTSHEEG
jgi:hypothetical protein